MSTSNSKTRTDSGRYVIRAKPLSSAVPWIHYVSKRGCITGQSDTVAVFMGLAEARRELEYWRGNDNVRYSFNLEELPPRVSVATGLLRSEDVIA